MQDFLTYLKALPSDAWQDNVNEVWTVKDVVAHLVGWERECANVLQKVWDSKKEPWFLVTDEYDDFNARNVEEYKDCTPEQLLVEWEKWQNTLNEKIKEIGEENLRANPKLFAWVFDEGDDSHYEQHFQQIQKARR